MAKSIFDSQIQDQLVSFIDDFLTIPSSEVVFEGVGYVYIKEDLLIAQKKFCVLTSEALYIINKRRVANNPDQRFVTVRLNIKWSTIYFIIASIANSPNQISLPYQICFKLGSHFTNLFITSRSRFDQWRQALQSVSIQVDFDSKFTVSEKIGRGSSATVYKITNRESGEAYACKIFPKKTLKSDQRALKALINEISVLRLIKGHPNLVRLEEVHETPTSVCLITELIEGGKIFHDKRHYKSYEICNVIESLLSGLVFLKEKGIVHRDIKPDNLLLKYKHTPLHSNEIKIIDFGLATYYSQRKHVYEFCGTIGYIAPEILTARPTPVFSPAVDIFSFGIVLYNFVTRTKAFEGNSPDDVYRKNLKGIVNFTHPNFIDASPQRNLTSSGLTYSDARYQSQPANICNRCLDA